MSPMACPTTSQVRQASCVAVAGRALLIEGRPGSGKTALALALIDRGATLIGDDAVTLQVCGGALWAAPPPNIAGLVEIRNVGIGELPTTEAPVALLLRLDLQAPRQPETIDSVEIAGCAIPAIAFHPGGPIPALRAEWALALHGLPLASTDAQSAAR